ncbi:ATP-binding cassette domain-containing protein [Leptobacterium flavescens]|uniref:ATP-binding cassette domain-containing protein n=1 Tax=Leptobacterium flavescens TaxID=472055 RepID=A0A6P0UVC5_9FLAO|nr:phosphate ABC transporter ATP-binding protein [Leptobacterium flavescens]NER14763.1 ATP-binding cassette domain-containing protein [Leptobacterium flavescens]
MELKELKEPIADIKNNTETIINVSGFNVTFGETRVLKDIAVSFYERQVNCIIGPSGSGKSTLLRSINRINEGTDQIDINGMISFKNTDIYGKDRDLTLLRKEIGMVFQRPCVFPRSILENVVFGIQHHQKLSKAEKLEIAETQLKAVSLWTEVSSRLHEPAHSLSIGQQQRLCIARALAVKPSVLLMDEPTSSLDPVSSRVIEELMSELKKEYTIVLVTHNIAQAQRISDHLIFMCEGKVIESGDKEKLFCNPDKIQTKTYLKDEYCDCNQ